MVRIENLPPKAHGKRKWFQFRLRAIFLATPALCLVLAVTVAGVRRQNEYRQAWHALAVLRK